MDETTQTTTRSWPRDIAILLLAALLGGAIFYVAFGRDGGGGDGTTVAGDAGDGVEQGGEELPDVEQDPDLQVEQGANADVEPVDPADAVDAETAVESFLAAEVQRDFEASFGLLTDENQSRLGNVAQWRSAHAQLPVFTGFELLGETEQGGDPAIRSVVALDSTLDQVVGLVPARAEANWVVEETADGFRVDFDTSFIQPLYPDDDPASDAAIAWAQAVQSGEDTGELQAVSILYGSPPLRDVVAESSGDFEAGAPVTLPPNGGSSDLVSAFGAEVVDWARAVPLGGAVEVTLVLAPIEDEWRVIAILDPSAV